jgi:hypothetical protein
MYNVSRTTANETMPAARFHIQNAQKPLCNVCKKIACKIKRPSICNYVSWRAAGDSNPRPQASEACTLSN